MLGARLETEMDGSLRDHAGLCYICSGNVEKFVQWWYVKLFVTASNSPVFVRNDGNSLPVCLYVKQLLRIINAWIKFVPKLKIVSYYAFIVYIFYVTR